MSRNLKDKVNFEELTAWQQNRFVVTVWQERDRIIRETQRLTNNQWHEWIRFQELLGRVKKHGYNQKLAEDFIKNHYYVEDGIIMVECTS